MSDHGRRELNHMALGEIARRHAAMVYAIARRLVGDPHLADDVTQAVFILLLQKAGNLRNEAHLVGWLHTTTRHAAANARKMEQRRKHYEARAGQRAVVERREQRSRENHWAELSPVIDEALAGLGERDRQAILLRYICGKGVADVAAATNVTPAAAKKRLRRGLEKLRLVLSRRGVVMPATLLASTLMLSRNVVHGATGELPNSILNLLNGSSRAAAGSSTASTIAARTGAHVARWQTMAAAAAIIIAAALAICFALDGKAPLEQTAQADPTSAKPIAPPAAPAPPVTSEPTANITAVGQLVALPGQVVGSPTPVDLDGDGEPEIVVPYMGMVSGSQGSMTGDVPLTNGREPDLAAYVGAFHLDGSAVPGFPVVVMSAEHHKQAGPNEFPNWWLGTPAVRGAHNGQSGVIVIGHPSGPAKADRGISIIRGDGSHLEVAPPLASPDPGSTLMLIDADGNAANEATVILGAATACTLDGHVPTTWTSKKPPAGFSCSAGDVRRDGQTAMFLVTQRHGSANASVVATDRMGRSLSGWPQKVGGKSFAAPSLGNVFGDDKLEVIVPDFRRHLLAWTCDGKRFGSTFEEAEGHSYDGGQTGLSPEQLQQEKCTSIFKDDINCAGPAALADLDGDGRAEIIVVDADAATLRAWHGDGSPAFAGGDADGVVAHLSAQGNVFGVSVAGPDDNGAFDFFAGNDWVHRDREGHVNVRQMMDPGPAPGGKIDTTCQDTICDIDGDGRADILIGTADGRVVIFHTGVKYTSRWAQWPMLGANPQRTGCWQAALPSR